MNESLKPSEITSSPHQHPNPGQHVRTEHVQGRPGDQAGSLHPGGCRASEQGPAAAGRQTPRSHDRRPRADGQVRPGAADHDGAERRRRQEQGLCLQPQAEETPQQGHSGHQEVRGNDGLFCKLFMFVPNKLVE